MSDWWPLFVAIATPAALQIIGRLLDTFLPPGTHIRLPKRIFERDRPTKEDDDEQ